jgi:radical SAM superfamily enzyme YgiQ (UPF0313 family)
MTHKFKKLCLVSSAQLQYTRPSAGLAFLAGVCEHNNIDYVLKDINVEFFHRVGQNIWDQCFGHVTNGLKDLPADLESIVDNFLDHLIQDIISDQVDCIALTVLTSYNQGWALKFLEKFQKVSNIEIIAGGPGLAVPCIFLNDTSITFGRYLLDNNFLNYYVLGEGDVIFDQFLNGVRSAVGLNSAGLPETRQPQIDDLNCLPMPSYKKFDFSLYPGVNNENALSITTSRGCVRRCSFCDIGTLWKKFRYRDGKNVADEIVKHHLDTGVTNFWFTDSLINGSLKSFTELLRTLVEYKTQHSLPTFKLSSQFIIRPKESHPEKLFKLMKEAGVDHIQVGIESGSEAVRNHIGKKFSNADIDWHFEMCEKYKIKNWLLIMASYPTETKEDFEATLNMFRRYQKYIINKTALGVNLMTPTIILHGTPLESYMGELGIEFASNNQDFTVATNPELTLKERYIRMIKMIKLAISLGYEIPSEVEASMYQHKKHVIDLGLVDKNAFVNDNKRKVIPINKASIELSTY